jgi:release factor glutamine methyltransferase
MKAAPVRNAEANASLETLTLRGALQRGTARLADARIESAALDAELLLCHALAIARSELYVGLEKLLTERHGQTYDDLLERRAGREPMAYITGLKEFWSLDFMVTPAVLIPRPETELLVELALDWAGGVIGPRSTKILELGTGSGAIAVSLAKHLPESEVWAVDISSSALGVAEANAERHGVQARVRFRRGDLFDALDVPAMKFDMILSNPPYVRTAELAELAPEIRDWEPPTALDGGADGLNYYRRIIGTAQGYLNDGGRIVLEIGADLAEEVAQLFASAGGYGSAKVYRDYAGRDRALAAVKGMRHG